MAITSKPEILPPSGRLRGRTFEDENLDLLSHLLDDCFRVPGTSIRFGLDGIVGFIPGVGDAIAGIASCVIIIAAWARGVSYVTLTRMLANWGIEVLLGSLPVLGNLFDIAWKANRRNYALLTGSMADPQGIRRRSWLFLAVLCIGLAALLIAPILLLGWLSVHLMHAATRI
ncbi:MAG TPA: DUF4112 domain-containing protein [Acidobacteriaceae bacterium]|jgi:hypothetical protein|nr:DUF4112 domain-containing protein [Acidobacteriaceae bacterium]